METLTSYKCMNDDTVDSFCGCIAGDMAADPAAKAFCNRAKTDKNITSTDLFDLKSAILDPEGCCDCCEC